MYSLHQLSTNSINKTCDFHKVKSFAHAFQIKKKKKCLAKNML